MSFDFTGSYGLPQIHAALETVERQFWWGPYADQIWVPAVIEGPARDAGNTTTDVLRPGLLLGRLNTSEGVVAKLTEYDPVATDGSQRIYGILGYAQKMQRMGSNHDRWVGFVMIAGKLKANDILIPGSTSYGIVGATTEYLIRAQLQSRFMFDDIPTPNFHGGWRDIQAKTADYTVTEADNNVLFTTRGAAGTVNFTLPATAKKGLRFAFYCAANQTLTVTAGTADTMTAINDLTADSVSYATASLKIGGMFEVIGDGTGWLVINHPGQTSDGTTSGQLVTVAT